jgi:hypothetical protein
MRRLYGAYVLVLVLGLRKGEVPGLRWEHVSALFPTLPALGGPWPDSATTPSYADREGLRLGGMRLVPRRRGESYGHTAVKRSRA